MLTGMRHSRPARIFALMLAVFVAFGTSMSVIRASDMAGEMASMSASGAADDGKCGDCGDQGPGMKATGCSLVACTSPALAVLSQSQPMVRAHTRELPSPEPPLLVGWASSPDPHPPRS